MFQNMILTDDTKIETSPRQIINDSITVCLLSQTSQSVSTDHQAQHLRGMAGRESSRRALALQV